MKKLSAALMLLIALPSFAVTEKESEILDRYTGYYKIVPNLFTLSVPKLKPFDNCLEARYEGGVLEVTRGENALNFKSSYQWLKAPLREIDKVTQVRHRSSSFIKKQNGADRQHVNNGDTLTTEKRAYTYSTYNIHNNWVSSRDATVSRSTPRFTITNSSSSHRLAQGDHFLTTSFSKGTFDIILNPTCDYTRITKAEYDQMLDELDTKNADNKNERARLKESCTEKSDSIKVFKERYDCQCDELASSDSDFKYCVSTLARQQ